MSEDEEYLEELKVRGVSIVEALGAYKGYMHSHSQEDYINLSVIGLYLEQQHAKLKS